MPAGRPKKSDEVLRAHAAERQRRYRQRQKDVKANASAAASSSSASQSIPHAPESQSVTDITQAINALQGKSSHRSCLSLS